MTKLFTMSAAVLSLSLFAWAAPATAGCGSCAGDHGDHGKPKAEQKAGKDCHGQQCDHAKRKDRGDKAAACDNCKDKADRAKCEDCLAKKYEPVMLEKEAQKSLDELTKAYLGVSEQFAADSLEEVGAELDQVEAAANQLAEQAEHEKFQQRARLVAKRADFKVENLDQARKDYRQLSKVVIGLNRHAQPSDKVAEGLYVARCPMTDGGSWLQTDQTVSNPYMGSKMLRCGGIQHTLKKNAGDRSDDEGRKGHGRKKGHDGH
ncbi:MAG: hypothetical protein ACLFV3_12135 [Phycisphaeraceae bacterium]